MSHNVKLNIYTDGGARGNPGPAAIAFVVTDERENILKEFGKTIGNATNNIAEYFAVVEALSWIKNNFDQPINKINFFLDSQLAVNQLNGFYKIKNCFLREAILKIKILEVEIKNKTGGEIFYHLIPREKNCLADKLVNSSLDRESRIL